MVIETFASIVIVGLLMVLLFDLYFPKKYRIVKLNRFGEETFKIQEKGFLFWRDKSFMLSPYTDIYYFDTFEKALAQVKALKKPEEIFLEKINV